jgi:hypothetical protein
MKKEEQANREHDIGKIDELVKSKAKNDTFEFQFIIIIFWILTTLLHLLASSFPCFPSAPCSDHLCSIPLVLLCLDPSSLPGESLFEQPPIPIL